MARRSPPLPKYVDEIPDHLATTEQLARLGLKPGTSCPVALVELNSPDHQCLTGLFERVHAVPKADAAAGCSSRAPAD